MCASSNPRAQTRAPPTTVGDRDRHRPSEPPTCIVGRCPVRPPEPDHMRSSRLRPAT